MPYSQQLWNNSIKIIDINKNHICRRLRWAQHVARMEESRSVLKILTGKPTGKRISWRPRRRWEDTIRMVLEEIGINTRNWVDAAKDRVIGEPL